MPLLQTVDLTKSFGGIRAVERLSLSLGDSQITGLIGPNGAGKSTVFNLITGFLPPDAGRVLFNSKDITRHSPHKLVELGLARCWQGVRLFNNLAAIENVAMAVKRPSKGGRFSGLIIGWTPISGFSREIIEKARHYIEMVGLAGKSRDVVADLSFAERKLVSIAMLLATEARLLLLDEPASGLDARSLTRTMFPLLFKLAEAGRTLFLVEHNIELVKECCKKVFFMHHGALLAEGTPEEITRDSELKQIYFGT